MRIYKEKYLRVRVLLPISLILLFGTGMITAQEWQGYTYSEIDYQWESCDTILRDRAGDDVMYTTLLPFDFKYCNMTKSAGITLYVDTNGRLSWTDLSSDYTPTETEFKAEQDIAVSWIDMNPYGTIYQCNLDAGGLNERTLISWNTSWYSGNKTVFQVVLYKNGDIIINYANMSNASTAGQTGKGMVYKGISRGNNTYWTLNNWNNINENLSQKSFRYRYQSTGTTTTTITTTSTTSTTTTSTTTITTTTTTTTSLPICELGCQCSYCTGWVSIDITHTECTGSFNGCVRDGNDNGKYDQICCSGVVSEISAI